MCILFSLSVYKLLFSCVVAEQQQQKQQQKITYYAIVFLIMIFFVSFILNYTINGNNSVNFLVLFMNSHNITFI